MGGAPSRETLVRSLVRESGCDARTARTSKDRLGTQSSHENNSDDNNNNNENTNTHVDATLENNNNKSTKRSQPEIVLIPLIPDYFPSSHCPLFQQLLAVRREAAVHYYYRDCRTSGTVSESHMPSMEFIGNDKEVYSLYMSLSEQRMVETDNELVALCRAGRGCSPVPCAVAFVYDTEAAAVAVTQTNSTTAATSATAVTAMTPPADADNNNVISNSHKAETTTAKKKKRSSAKHGAAAAATTTATNTFMSIENTVRLPHHSIRVRVFGFVGDTRFCPPSMQASTAVRSPMEWGIFLSRSAGGNHRVQVSMLAAYTYATHLRQCGIINDCCDLKSYTTTPSLAAAKPPGGGGGAGMWPDVLGELMPQSAAQPFYDNDPYAISTDVGHTTAAAANASSHQTPPNPSSPSGAAPGPLWGSCMSSPSSGGTATLGQYQQDSVGVVMRPIEFLFHKADVPALCFVREMRARLKSAYCGSNSSSNNNEAGATTDVIDLNTITATNSNSNCKNACRSQVMPPCIHTYIDSELLKGNIRAEDVSVIFQWASSSYASTLPTLASGEATKLRKVLAETNLTQNTIVGTLFVAAQDPYSDAQQQQQPLMLSPPQSVLNSMRSGNKNNSSNHKVPCSDGGAVAAAPAEDDARRSSSSLPIAGDVWVTTQDTYVASGANVWTPVSSGAVLRYCKPEGVWRPQEEEFAEDILLTLCRDACQKSRRATPQDLHWICSPHEEGGGALIPEGLEQGFLVWREEYAGQCVYLGTTPGFLKKWLTTGDDNNNNNSVKGAEQGTENRHSTDVIQLYTAHMAALPESLQQQRQQQQQQQLGGVDATAGSSSDMPLSSSLGYYSGGAATDRLSRSAADRSVRVAASSMLRGDNALAFSASHLKGMVGSSSGSRPSSTATYCADAGFVRTPSDEGDAFLTSMQPPPPSSAPRTDMRGFSNNNNNISGMMSSSNRNLSTTTPRLGGASTPVSLATPSPQTNSSRNNNNNNNKTAMVATSSSRAIPCQKQLNLTSRSSDDHVVRLGGHSPASAHPANSLLASSTSLCGAARRVSATSHNSNSFTRQHVAVMATSAPTASAPINTETRNTTTTTTSNANNNNNNNTNESSLLKGGESMSSAGSSRNFQGSRTLLSCSLTATNRVMVIGASGSQNNNNNNNNNNNTSMQSAPGNPSYALMAPMSRKEKCRPPPLIISSPPSLGMTPPTHFISPHARRQSTPDRHHHHNQNQQHHHQQHHHHPQQNCSDDQYYYTEPQQPVRCSLDVLKAAAQAQKAKSSNIHHHQQHQSHQQHHQHQYLTVPSSHPSSDRIPIQVGSHHSISATAASPHTHVAGSGRSSAASSLSLCSSGSVRSELGNGRYRWDWRASPVVSSHDSLYM